MTTTDGPPGQEPDRQHAGGPACWHAGGPAGAADSGTGAGASIHRPEGSATGQAEKPRTARGTKAPQWKLLISGLVIALIMTTIMVTTYVSAEHGVVGHNVPWGVTGNSSLTTAVEKKISLDIHHYANQSDLENAANHATIYGGFVPQTNTLIINEAASLWAPGVMPAYYGQAAKAQAKKRVQAAKAQAKKKVQAAKAKAQQQVQAAAAHGNPQAAKAKTHSEVQAAQAQAKKKVQAAKAKASKAHVKVINKLPKQDPEGVVPGLVVFVLLVSGYLASTLAMQRTGAAAAHRRVISLICFAIVAGLVFDVIVGPILGAYPNVSSNFWALWGEFALMSLAVAFLTATLQSLVGPMGTLVAVIIVVFFGNPSTGGVNGTAFLPSFWQFIGPGLPPLNGVLLIRNTLYFHGNSLTQPIVVLSVYVVVGMLLVHLFSWGRLFWWRGQKDADREHRSEVISPEEEVGVAAVPPG